MYETGTVWFTVPLGVTTTQSVRWEIDKGWLSE